MMDHDVSVVISLVDNFTKGMSKITKSSRETISAIDKVKGVSIAVAGATAKSSQEMVSAIDKVKGVSIAVAGATAFGLKKAIDAASEFQSNLTPLNTVVTSTLGGVKQSIDTIGDASLAWSAKHKNSANEFLQASYMMSSAGLNDVQAIAGTQTSLALATATMGDATEAANLMGLMYNNFGDKSKDANAEMMRIGDTLSKTQALFQIANLGQLNEGLKYASASALSAKISFNEMNTAVGMLNTVGLQGSMAGTSFAQITAKMSAASEKLGFSIANNADGGIDFINTLGNLQKSMKGLDSITQGNMLRDAFGDEAARGVALLLPKLKDMQKAMKDIEGASGFLKKSQKAMEGDFKSQMIIFRNNINNLMVNIGTPLLAVLNPLTQGMTKVIAVFNWLIQTVPGLKPLLAGLAVYVLFAALKMTVFSFILKSVKSGLDIRKEAKFFTSALGSVSKSSGMSVLSLTSLKGVLTSLKTGGFSGLFSVFSGQIKAFTGQIWKLIASTKAGSAATEAYAYQMKLAQMSFFSGKTISASTAGFKAITTAMKAFAGVILTNPITYIIIAIIALVAWIAFLVRHWDKMKEATMSIFKPLIDQFNRLKNNLKGILNIFKPITDAIVKAFPFKKITISWDSLLYWIGYGVGVMMALFEVGLGTWLSGILGMLNAYIDAFKGFIDQIFSGISDIWNGLKLILSGDILNGLLEISNGIIKIVTAPLVAAINLIIGLVNNVTGTLNTIKINIPKGIPGIGGMTLGFNIPQIPQIPSFSKGVENFNGGLAYVHKDELISMPSGSNVHTKKEVRDMFTGRGGTGGTTVHNHYYTIQKVELGSGETIKTLIDMFTGIEREVTA